MVAHQKEVNYILKLRHIDFTHKTNTRRQLLWMVKPTMPRMITHQPKDGHPTQQNEVNYGIGISS